MIYTITLNPAVDYYITLDSFKEGELNISNTGYFLAGGKGINVSKVLNNCGIKNISLGFVGGFTGEFIIKELEKLNIENDFIIVDENTRINVKIKTEEKETEVAGVSSKISSEKLSEFFSKLKIINKEDLVILSGSVPISLEQTIYKKIIESLSKGTKIILDTRGKAFRNALESGVFLSKPNKKEVEEFFEMKFKTMEEIVSAGRELQKLGSENVVISLGKEGAILLTKDKVYIGNAPKGITVSSVGSGDSMVAGILYGIENKFELEESFKYGIAAGSATAFKKGLANLEEIQKLVKEIKVKRYI